MKLAVEWPAGPQDKADAPQQHLLLVDDEPRYRSGFRALLQAPGRVIHDAAGGAAALQALQTLPIDLVLLDLGLPDLPGLELLRWISAHRSNLAVIIVSGTVQLETAMRSLRLGALDCVRKPEDLDVLPDRVAHVLRRQRQQRAHAASAAHMAQSERLYRFLVESSPDIVYTLDDAGRFVFVNPRTESLLGYPRDSLVGRHSAELLHADDAERARFVLAERRSDARASTNVEVRLLCHPGMGTPGGPQPHRVTMVSAIGLYREGQGGPRHFTGTYGVVRDITERKRAEESISFQALHDPLTQLPNRRLFKDHLELALAQAERRGRMVGVMFIDMDRFKRVNDSHGHQAGDKLLLAFAQRLRGCVRAGDTVGRQGGDEFTVLLPDLLQEADAMIIADKIRAALEPSFPVAGQDFRATASIGVAVYPRDGGDADRLLRNADIAMYAVKSGGRNGGRMFDAEMGVGQARRAQLEDELRRAVLRQEFVLHYQPMFSHRHGAMVGVEVLLRWQHPRQGLLNPGHFIHLAEETGLIADIGTWVAGEACAQLARWHASGLPGLRASINVSPLEFARADLAERIVGQFTAQGLPRDTLQIEITETLLLDDAPGVAAKLQHLHDCGVRVAVDDFGTRHSSLNHLHRLPLNTLKIDQSFVRDIVSGESVFPMIHAIAGVARGFGLQLVAEGVETEQQRSVLAELGCDEMQGYLFAAPMPADELWRRHGPGAGSGRRP